VLGRMTKSARVRAGRISTWPRSLAHGSTMTQSQRKLRRESDWSDIRSTWITVPVIPPPCGRAIAFENAGPLLTVVMPAKAGIHGRASGCGRIDSGFRRNDEAKADTAGPYAIALPLAGAVQDGGMPEPSLTGPTDSVCRPTPSQPVPDSKRESEGGGEEVVPARTYEMARLGRMPVKRPKVEPARDS
jgi:hypothetical protein